jgi:starch phosphorylase
MSKGRSTKKTKQPVATVEDDRTGMSSDTIERAILDHLCFTRSKDLNTATALDIYYALAHTVRDRLTHRWINTRGSYYQSKAKRVYYFSAEYLLGRALMQNLINLGMYDEAKQVLAQHDIDLTNILEQEVDPGLGNGGLGRLAACFLDSMATLGLPGYGYGIRYEFGIFRQEIRDGWQVEQPDDWLRYGNPWEIVRHEFTVEVPFFGRVENTHEEDGTFRPRWVDTQTVLGVPYDTPIAGYGNNTVNTLRLWAARASSDFDLQVFNDGDYRRAVEQKAISESISKVLYPKDNTPTGKELRLKQQFFFVCCSIQDLVRRYKKTHDSFDEFASQVAIQLNDTHPAIAIAEMMRVLLDKEHLEWDKAWDITRHTFAYTNHTLLPEALEQWPLPMFERLLPRHLQIIYEINHRFLNQVHIFAPHDQARKRRMSIIGEEGDKTVRMAHLSVVGSHSVNGVAALHSKLLTSRVLKDFAEMWPERFNNKTNGVTPRRWLYQCNPRLATLISQQIGTDWIKQLDKLEGLAPLANDAGFHESLRNIKHSNKVDLAGYIKQNWGLIVNPESIFDVQIKRIHEYKRQLLNCIHIIHLYHQVKFEDKEITPRTFLFGGKAAPGYIQAKYHIKLINDIAQTINQDPKIRDQIKVLYMHNYGVSMAERIFPASDISEQISMAGKEASGTGNMKFQMNGALTLGTLDGANIEIREEVGEDNFFLFGHQTEEVLQIKEQGYNPMTFIAESQALKNAIKLLESGFFSPSEPDRYHSLISYITELDPYLICADFESYRECQEKASQTYQDQDTWNTMVVHNLAHAGKFSSDRTIDQYAKEIWDVHPVDVTLPS